MEGDQAMSKKANSEIAAEFVAYLHGQGREVFKETRTIGQTLQHEFLYIAPAGKQGESTTLHELCEKVAQWGQATGRTKSHAQVEHISSIIWSHAENRTSAPGPRGVCRMRQQEEHSCR
jgi:hypothetical protein